MWISWGKSMNMGQRAERKNAPNARRFVPPTPTITLHIDIWRPPPEVAEAFVHVNTTSYPVY